MKAHRLVHHSTLGWRVIKKKKKIITSGEPGQTKTELDIAGVPRS